MEPLTQHQGLVYPLNRVNVDTDQIIPKQFLKRIERQGFGQFLFYNWRFDQEGNLNGDFSLNEPRYHNASILVSGHNFGCGSSREHAPWALQDYGFKIIIAPSFADIFYNNCFKNGILPITLPEDQVEELVAHAEAQALSLNVDVEQQTITGGGGFEATFQVPSYQKQMLLNGWDEIAMTLAYDDKISAFEDTRRNVG
ncbi:3-isopropylmalate dehydratase small subunit [Tuberibacillus sp. Marseille-P3662]|uniref:3-isopropylmalate dehydratase small subunit n=1 Tax=Tuberibacillus sp. Marseille-P3662 TaxID=1965358 RepID=UPI000A1CBA21|nr:3-isopropylmalate dehydratase small subunit [Tuberibacillus sp. Marseille-P3662]